MKKKNDLPMNEEFVEFLNQDSGVFPPNDVSNRFLRMIHQDLNPSALKVFGKTSLIHSVVGGFTLLFCPQFGLSYTSSMGLMPYLMKYGEGACMLSCGAVFTSLSLLVTAFLLRPEEVRVLEKNKVLQIGVLSTLSLGAMICLGGEVVFTLALVWMLGALLGGIASLELGWLFRRFQAIRR